MKRIITTLSLIFAALTTLHAQEINENAITFGQKMQNTINIDEDRIKLKIAGKELSLSSDEESIKALKYTESGKSISSLGVIELGINTLAMADYSMYTPEDAMMMQFGNRKSIYVATNFFTENFRLNKKGSLSIDMGVGIAWENYVFTGDYSMRYQEGMMRPILLDSKIEKSKLMARYLHMPVLLNWTCKEKFFIAAGVNLDVNIGTRLTQKDPKVVYKKEIVTLNPIQVAGTLRIGTEDFYGFVNYSFMEMFKSNTGPMGHRLSAGLGIQF
ncbi:MAG: outer membrane beta-barrel protein [Alistipes sp.]|nr:outer membrane beta-barrel protein [Alistipes sp.]